MKYRFVILMIINCMVAMPLYAQRDKDDRHEEQEEKKATNKNRVDFTVFRRQILTLPQFDEQKKKLAELKKKTDGIPKIYAVVDSQNAADDSKMLMGYIVTTLGDNSVNVYEIIFDRSLKKIVKVRATGETLEIEKPEAIERTDKNAKVAPKKKKKGDDEDDEDEDEDEPEEKPGKRKQKDDDD